MPQVAVQTINPDETVSHLIVEQLKALKERIRQRAYELFEHRGGSDGSALDDWLTAENELLIIPGSDLVETDNGFELEIALPGFDVNDIEVATLPDSLIVRAKSSHEQELTNADIQLSQFGEKCLFQRFDLPAPIDVDRVTANLNRDLLKITAPKAPTASAEYSVKAA